MGQIDVLLFPPVSRPSMDSADRGESTPDEDRTDPWDFPTLTSENFAGSPKARAHSIDVPAVPLSLAEAFLNYDDLLLFLEQDLRLEAILRNLAFYELLSERQKQEFSVEDPLKRNPARFLRFLNAADASALLAAVVILIGTDPVGKLLLLIDNPRVQVLLQQSKGFVRPVNSPKSPHADFYDVKRAQLSRNPPPPLNFSPTRTQPMVFPSSPATPTRLLHESLGPPPTQPMVFPTSPTTPRRHLLDSYAAPLSPSSITSPCIDMYDMPIPPIRNIPDEASDEQQFPYSIIRDAEINGSRVILTRTHTDYRDSSSRCFVAFNIVFQPNQDRFRRAEISMHFLPVASGKAPIILNIFPNANQIWPTGPSCDLTSRAKKFMNVTVGTATCPNLGANIGLENTTEIKSASNSSLTAAGIATSKLTISLSESRAGDGIIYSFAFAVVLDLKNEKKPDFSADLKVHWQLGNRIWFPRHKCAITEKVCFTKQTQLEEPSLSQLSNINA